MMFKIIDEEGRLFGKINVIDFLILAVVIIILPAFFHIYKIMGKTPTQIPFQWVKVKAVTFTISEVAEHFKEGDVCYDDFRNAEARLLKVIGPSDKYQAIYKYLPSKEHQGRNGSSYLIPILLEFELLCTRSAPSEGWYYRRAPLLVGFYYPVVFLSNNYQIDCYVIKIED